MLGLPPLTLRCRAFLLRPQRRIGTLDILLSGMAFPIRALLLSRGRCGRSLQRPLLIVLFHYGVMRLVAVILAVKRRLLFHAGIPLS
jgi:hypothetical protein